MVKNVKRKRRTKYSLEQWTFYFAIISIPLLQFFVFYVGTVYNSLTLPFKKYDGTGGFVWDSNLTSLKTMFEDLKYMDSLWRNSLVLYLTGTLVGTTLALLFSFYIYKKKFFSGGFRTFLFMPQIISGTALAIMWKYFMENGFPTIFEKFTGIEIPGLIENTLTQFNTILIFSIWAGFGSQVLMYSGAMSGISESIVEAGKIDGMSPLREFLHITIPSIWSTLVTFLVVGIAHFFTGQMNLHAFLGTGGGNKVSTFGYYIYKQLAYGDQSLYPYIASFGLMFTLIAVPTTFIFKYLLEKFGPRKE